MKTCKKFIALFLVIATAICSLTFSVSAVTIIDGDFGFEVNSDGNAIIVEYTGTDAVVEIPEYLNGFPVVGIGSRVFNNNSNITSIDIPNTITSIGNYAFAGCSSLKEVSIPSSVSTMGTNIFNGCEALSFVEFNASVTTISDNTFYNCSSLSEIIINSAITAIGNSAFMGCSALTTVPTAAIESYGQYAFYNSGLTSLVVSERVEHIPYYSFAYCSDLEKVVIFGTDTTIDDTAFLNSANFKIYCKTGSTAEEFADDSYYPRATINSDLGDANVSGSVSISDVTAIQKYRAKLIKFDELNLIYADVNGDNAVTIRDATTIQMFIAKYLDKL